MAAASSSASSSWWRRCLQRAAAVGEREGEDGESTRILPVPPGTREGNGRRRVSRKKAVLSLIACFIWVSMGGLVGLLGPAIPAIAKHLGVEDTELGWAFSVRAGGYIIGSLITSRLPERGPSKVMVMAIAAVVASAVNLAIPHSNAMLLFLVLCFFQGIGLSIISTLGNIVLLEYWGAKAGPWLQGLHFCFGIGAILSSLILGVCGLGVAFSTFAAVGMAPMVAVLAVEGLPRRIRRLTGRGNAATKSSSASASASASISATGAGAGDSSSCRRMSGNNKLDDPRKVSSANLLSLSSQRGPEDGERDEKEGPDAGADGAQQQQQQQHLHHHHNHRKRLSVSIMPFQETVLPVPVNQEDGGLDIEALLAGLPASSSSSSSGSGAGSSGDFADDSLTMMDTSVTIATDLNLNASAHGGPATAATAPLPDSIKWLLTIFLGLYVGGECGFGGWISSFVLLEGATQSEAKAAFLVSIFWAAVTIGRAVAVGQAMVIGPSVSLRLQLSISLAGALTFLALGATSFKGAAIAAAVFGYGMSSIYPLGMSWPGEAGFSMGTATTATLVIGGCVGEAVVPLIIGGVMHWLGPAILPLAILSVVTVLALALGTVEGLGRAALSQRSRECEAQAQDEDVEYIKVGEERQSRAPTAAGDGAGRDDVEAACGATAAQRARVSFVVDKALDASVGTSKVYHHRLSLSGGTGGFTLARASAAFMDGGKGPPKGITISGGSSDGAADGRVTVHTTYGT